RSLELFDVFPFVKKGPHFDVQAVALAQRPCQQVHLPLCSAAAIKAQKEDDFLASQAFCTRAAAQAAFLEENNFATVLLKERFRSFMEASNVESRYVLTRFPAYASSRPVCGYAVLWEDSSG